MNKNKKNIPDLNLVYILGFFFKSIPISLLNSFLRYAMKGMVNKHIDLFTRLNEEDNLDFIIEVNDLPFDFYMKTDTENPILLVIKKENNIKANAKIKGSLQNLLLMLEGKLDGDAAFFAKKLIIEGKTEHIVALRNALDSVEINILEDLVLPLHKVIQKPVKTFAKLGLKKYQQINQQLQDIKYSIIGSIENKVKTNKKDIEVIKQDLYHVEKELIKFTRGPLRKKY